MSKLICEVCGTSYPENASQCPICGCVRPADAESIPDDTTQDSGAGTYQFVKGGRFSKSNVRKRNAGGQTPARSAQDTAKKKEQTKTEKPAESPKKKSNIGLIITIIVLLLAIIAVAAYIVITYVIPVASISANDETIGQVDTIPPTEPKRPCTSVSVEAEEILLYAIDEEFTLSPLVEPSDTTDTITYSSDNETVATVDENGSVTILDFGEAIISITCGNATAYCHVIIDYPLVLDGEEFLLEGVGATQIIYSGEIPLSEIQWYTEDDSVALVVDGIVFAVGNGTTSIYGEYKDQLAVCSVTCQILEETTPEITEGNDGPTEPEETTPPTEADDREYTAPYELVNTYGGSNSDVSLSVGETFVLQLRDANNYKVKSAQWSVDGSCVTVDDGTVTAVSSGMATVKVTYDGKSYTCVIHVY